MNWSFKVLSWSALLTFAAVSAARAEPVVDFYRGKTIEFLVAGAAAGATDVAARTVAKHLGKHIPGNPIFVVRNMPGATGLLMTNNLYNVAKRDGTVMGMTLSNELLEPRLKLLSPDGSSVKFDIFRMRWIGTPMQEPQVTWVWHTTPTKSFSDLKEHTILMGATAASADNSLLPLLINQLLGTRMKVVTGYDGQNAINIAVERGEIQGNNTGLSNLVALKSDWVRDRKFRVLLQFGAERHSSLPDVPTAAELTTSEDDRAMLLFYALKFTMARPIVLPPDVPNEQAQILETAFNATMKDNQYLDEARRLGLDNNWLGSEEMTKQLQLIQRTPQQVVDRLRAFMTRAETR
jgi:tripartite-type tricarboxylate transporter receptor subunit TctC